LCSTEWAHQSDPRVRAARRSGTGRPIASVPVKGDKPSIGQIFVGRNALYYVATNTHDAHGYVTRVTASRR
jgi:hypothetical protein